MSVPVNYGNILKEIQMYQCDIDIICDKIKNMPADGLMIEWGSGGSTCKWLETLSNDQNLITIEHNESWYNRVTRAIAAEFGDVSNKFSFNHIPEKFIEHGYANLIEEHPCGTDEYLVANGNDKIWDADIYFIDGIARAACALTVLYKRRKPNSVVMIHDYVGREPWYSWSSQFYNVETFETIDPRSSLAVLTEKR